MSLAVDLDQGDVQLRLDGDDLGVVAAAVGQVDAQVLRVEDVAVDGQDVAVRRDEDAGAVGRQALEAAGAEQLDQLLVDLLGHLGERLVGAGRRRPGEQGGQRRAAGASHAE